MTCSNLPAKFQLRKIQPSNFRRRENRGKQRAQNDLFSRQNSYWRSFSKFDHDSLVLSAHYKKSKHTWPKIRPKLQQFCAKNGVNNDFSAFLTFKSVEFRAKTRLFHVFFSFFKHSPKNFRCSHVKIQDLALQH